MIAFKITSFFLAATLLLVGCLRATAPPSRPDYTEMEIKGREVFIREGCYQTCHAVGAVSGPRKQDLRLISLIPDLTTTPARTDDWYLAYLLRPRDLIPRSTMPSYQHLPPEDLSALVAYLQRLRANAPTPTPQPVDPLAIRDIPSGPEVYRDGRQLYSTYCQGCHGIGGQGNGPAGHLLSPEPRDLTDALWMNKQTDAYLFAVITNGKPDTAMPGYADTLDIRQRTLLISYMRFFPDPVARQRMEIGLLQD